MSHILRSLIRRLRRCAPAKSVLIALRSSGTILPFRARATALLLIVLFPLISAAASVDARSDVAGGLWWPQGSRVPVLLIPETASNPPRVAASSHPASSPVRTATPRPTPRPATSTPSSTRTTPPTSTAQPSPTPTATPSGAGAIALGVYLQDGSRTVNSDPSFIDAYAGLVGRMPAIVNVGSDWVHYPNFDPAVMDAIRARGATPMWSWLPDDYSQGAAQSAFTDRAIANGAFDGYIQRFATDARNWGHPFFLRFAYEMNGNWYPWGTAPGNPNGNSPADYVAAWRHVHDIFTRVGAGNVRWVWCPNVEHDGTGQAAPDYPGDAYVDWIGLDGYNYGQGTGGGGWQTLADVFGPTYAEITGMTSKPLMIGEIASAEQGGSKADWITQGFLTTIPNQFPRVRAVVWFDVVAERDWRVDSSVAALAAFRSVVSTPLYQGSLP